MTPWHKVITPHADLRAGNLDEAVFAADLSDALAGRGPLEYRDAATFFRKTYPTQGLVNLLAAMLARLGGSGSGEAVIQIQTPFGGGKTHSLIALFHLFRHAEELKGSEAVAEVLAKAGARAVPKTRVAAFVGTEADALQGRTPWGELATQLGRYGEVREHDQRRRSPGKAKLHELLAGEPTLILMDEIAEYAVKARDFRDQVVAFFQELTETVRALPQCAMVVTLPSSAPYAEQGERALHELQQVFRRVETIRTPVEGEEIYEVIRRRLFEDLRNPQEANQTVEAYFEMYQRLADDVPREVREPRYRERMRRAYPFHPELIDLLFERWSSYPGFQRTRGALRLLAQVVAELCKKEHSSPLIQPCDVNPGNPAVRGELLRHIGSEYLGVIASDIAGEGAKAERIDREMGSEYSRFGVASRLARSIFFGSFSGSDRRGLGVQRLRLAALQPDMPPAIVGDALRRLEEELWYLQVHEGRYAFSSQPNLNRLVVEKTETVDDEEIEAEIRAQLQKLAGNEWQVRLWPQQTQDVPDTRKMQLVVLGSEHLRSPGRRIEFVEELLTKCGQTFRTYKNALVVLAPDANEWLALREQVKQYLALRAIREDRTLHQQLHEENKQWLMSKMKDAEHGIGFRIISTYRHVAKAGGTEAAWFDLGLPTVGERSLLTRRVGDFLRAEDVLVSRLPPRRVLEKALRPDDNEKPVGEIVEAFLKYPHLPMLESEKVVREAIVQGVRDGLFGIRMGDEILFRVALSADDLDDGAILVRAAAIQAVPPPEGGRAVAAGPEPTAVRETAASACSPSQPSESGIRFYKVHAQVPWDKLTDVVRGVIGPLRNDGAELEVEVIVTARSPSGGIRESTLNQKVRETLSQIGAHFEEESDP